MKGGYQIAPANNTYNTELAKERGQGWYVWYSDDGDISGWYEDWSVVIGPYESKSKAFDVTQAILDQLLVRASKKQILEIAKLVAETKPGTFKAT